MSSPVAHSLAALSIGLLATKRTTAYRALWFFWFVVVSLAPDLDYVLKCLHASGHGGIRITHSIAMCSILPLLTFIILKSIGIGHKKACLVGLVTLAASLSHIVLDFGVGVSTIPILWPYSRIGFRLPWGILPSASDINLLNQHMYRNTAIELGIFVPICVGIQLFKEGKNRTVIGILILAILVASIGYCMYCAHNLPQMRIKL